MNAGITRIKVYRATKKVKLQRPGRRDVTVHVTRQQLSEIVELLRQRTEWHIESPLPGCIEVWHKLDLQMVVQWQTVRSPSRA